MSISVAILLVSSISLSRLNTKLKVITLFVLLCHVDFSIPSYRKFSWQHAINWNVSQKGYAGMLERGIKVHFIEWL